jgi:hypothetical protein
VRELHRELRRRALGGVHRVRDAQEHAALLERLGALLRDALRGSARSAL